jgi:hypothetical protein
MALTCLPKFLRTALLVGVILAYAATAVSHECPVEPGTSIGWPECSRLIDCDGWCEHKTIPCGKGDWYTLYYQVRPCRDKALATLFPCSDAVLPGIRKAIADCPVTKDLAARAVAGGGVGTDTDIACGEEGSRWIAQDRLIELDSQPSRCRMILSLIQEFSNAANQKQFVIVFEDASQGNVSREEFIRALETTEYFAAHTRVEAFDQCGGQWGCDPSDLPAWERLAGFENYFEALKLINPNHPEEYGEFWDKTYKTAYEKKHPPK